MENPLDNSTRTKYLVEIEVVNKTEMPPDAQDIELLPFLADHLYDLTKHHDATKWVIIVNDLYERKSVAMFSIVEDFLKEE